MTTPRNVIANQLNGHHGDRQGCTGYSGCTTCADDILAALDRAGLVVVPKMPTEEMYLAMLCQLPDTAFTADIKKALASVIRVGSARPSDVCEWEKSGISFFEYRTSCGILTPGPSSHCYTCRRPVTIVEDGTK